MNKVASSEVGVGPGTTESGFIAGRDDHLLCSQCKRIASGEAFKPYKPPSETDPYKRLEPEQWTWKYVLSSSCPLCAIHFWLQPSRTSANTICLKYIYPHAYKFKDRHSESFVSNDARSMKVCFMDQHGQSGPLCVFRRDLSTQYDHHYPIPLKRLADLSKAKSWLERCMTSHHSTCDLRIENLSGLWLIDCTQRHVVLATNKCSYAALSYVWGSTSYYDSCEGRLGPLTCETLPKTIRDAMEVCLALSFDYLWVDRYCIDHYDSATQTYSIDHMDLIYQAADLTIIAASGDSASSGLSGFDYNFRPLLPQAHLQNVHMYCIPNDVDNEKGRHNPWSKRGWCYQEQVLSRRVLWFHELDMEFTCQAMHCRESRMQYDDYLLDKTRYVKPIYDGRYRMHGKERVLQEPTLDHSYDDERWWAARWGLYGKIKGFTQRDLTLESDSIRAFCGILRKASVAEYPLYHIWGVPFRAANYISGYDVMPGFLIGLCWEHNRDHAKAIYRRPQIPSWTWAGWSGAVGRLKDSDPGLSVPIGTAVLRNDNRDDELVGTAFAERVENIERVAYPSSIIIQNTVVVPQGVLRYAPRNDDEILKHRWEVGSSFHAAIACSLFEPGSAQLQRALDLGIM